MLRKIGNRYFLNFMSNDKLFMAKREEVTKKRGSAQEKL
ncbi:hypothetical protein DB29_02822 [Shouchella clausii]|nr:hypothetical protein DB29_02822 [Shouchella clausii]